MNQGPLDNDPVDQPFLTGKRSYEGYYYLNGGNEYAIARGLAFAPYVEMVWCETATPDLGAEVVVDREHRVRLA